MNAKTTLIEVTNIDGAVDLAAAILERAVTDAEAVATDRAPASFECGDAGMNLSHWQDFGGKLPAHVDVEAFFYSEWGETLLAFTGYTPAEMRRVLRRRGVLNGGPPPPQASL